MYYDGKTWKTDNIGRMKILTDKVAKSIKEEPLFVADGLTEEDAIKNRGKHIKETRNHNRKVNMLKEAQHLLPVENTSFDDDYNKFNTQNGYIDLSAGLLHEHSREDYFTKISNTEFTENADCPRWEEFIHTIFDGNEEIIDYVHRAVGYSLSGFTDEQVLFVIYGNGRNGKSVFLNIINEIFGNYAENIQPQTLMADRNKSGATPGLAKLVGARFVTTTEPNEGDRFDEGLIKQITGGDLISARNLNENEFTYKPQFKLWMATNHKPYIRGTDDGIWRRFIIIPFTVQIPLKRVDKQLTEKLKEELPAILNWCVEGHLKYRKYGLKEPDSIKAQREEYRYEMSPIDAFIEDRCTVEESVRMKASEMFSVYDNWARENNQYRMSSTKFGKEFSKKFKRIRSNGYYYIGVKVKDENKYMFTLNN